MKDVLKHIEANGKTYPMAFNINVVEAIQEKYESLDAWSKIIMPDDKKEPKIKDVIFIYKECINEGIDMENDPECQFYVKQDSPRAFINEKQAGRIISALTDTKGAIADLVKESNDSGKEKNLMTEQNQTENMNP